MMRMELREAERIKSEYLNAVADMRSQIDGIRGEIAVKLGETDRIAGEMTTALETPAAMRKKMIEWEGALQGLHGLIDGLGDRIRTLNNRINAQTRWGSRREPEPEPETEIVPDTDQVSLLERDSRRPEIPAKNTIPAGFGKRRSVGG
jgi:hypothetical protein